VSVITSGRTSKSVVAWLDERGEDWKARVGFVAIDPCAAYRSAVEHALPHARVSADHFHLDRLAGEMVTGVRQRVLREQLGRRAGKNDSAWANRLLLRAGNRLSAPALDRPSSIFTPSSDLTGEISAAWGVKERFRVLLAATDRSTIADRLHRFHETVLATDLPEATRLAQTVDAWWPEILGFLETRITNAGTEGTNRVIKDAAQIAFGFATSTTNAAEYGSTAPGNHAGQPVPRRPLPLNFEEPG
jgi:transposase